MCLYCSKCTQFFALLFWITHWWEVWSSNPTVNHLCVPLLSSSAAEAGSEIAQVFLKRGAKRRPAIPPPSSN